MAVLEVFDMSFPFLSSKLVWLFVACDGKAITSVETEGLSGCGSANELSISIGCYGCGVVVVKVVYFIIDGAIIYIEIL